MDNNQPDNKPRFEPLTAIGAFLGIFGMAVCGAVVMDMPAADKAINLACGLLIAGIGAVCFIIGYRGRGSKD